MKEILTRKLINDLVKSIYEYVERTDDKTLKQDIYDILWPLIKEVESPNRG
jgi:hypothetical protein